MAGLMGFNGDIFVFKVLSVLFIASVKYINERKWGSNITIPIKKKRFAFCVNTANNF